MHLHPASGNNSQVGGSYGFCDRNYYLHENCNPDTSTKDYFHHQDLADPCFITSTKSATRATKTITTTLSNVTIKKILTKTATITKVIAAATSTSTILTTSTSTSVVPSTTTTTIVVTITEEAIATVTALPPDLCGSPFTFNGRNAFKYSGAVARPVDNTITTVSACCTFCYNTIRCANYVFDNTANTCTIFLTEDQADGCISNACPIGRVSGGFNERPTNELYGPGPCGGGIVR
ncbi:hypothetical protein ABW20_dc0104408 [Dactylellina cionopaga]|nr:hypothetical protein ABW20_dc0104408 [Dactylellina cionopaga]